MNQNRQLAVFRVKVADIIGNYSDRMKIFVVENTAIGMSATAIKAMKENPLSRWAMERETMIKKVKKEVGGLMTAVRNAAYWETR